MFYKYTDHFTSIKDMTSAIEEMCRLDKTVQTPHIACTKKDDKYYYCLDLPGVKKNDVEVSIEDKSLLVNWVRNNTSHSKQVSLYNSVSDLDLDSCEAALEDGVLTISFQVFKEKPKKKIVVK